MAPPCGERFAAAALAGAALVTCLTGAPSAGAPADVTLCRKYQHMPVTNSAGEHFIIRNDNYGGQRECITNSAGGANFRVSQSAADSANGEPVAFPYIFLGCDWGLCTSGTVLPARLSALRDPVTSWATSQRAGGTWDAAYDIWFSRKRVIGGQATGGEPSRP